MPVRIALDGLDEAAISRAFRWAADHGADVISCSWGPADGTGISEPLPLIVRAAIDRAVGNGRKGLGSLEDRENIVVQSVVVTSTGPGEGKTVVACDLTVALAQADQRVLLIDGHLRRPQVHEVFAQELEPGLSNLMVGSAKASDSVKKTSVPGLWALSAGRVPPNPAERLARA